MADLNDVLSECADLEEKLCDISEPSQRKQVILKHLNLVQQKLKFTVPDFQEGLKWLNVSTPLSFSHNLRGKLVILDFFTYCCINCMHVLPDLEAVENAHSIEDGVVVVGVHSAKFFNEKVTANILSAVLRYGITHPVVNDHAAQMWGQLMVSCWPTFVLVGPAGQLLYTYVGEGHRQNLLEFVEIALEYYKEKSEILDHRLPLRLELDNLPPSVLLFPGKVCVSNDGKMVVISDTGHNRLLVLGHDGVVKDVIGGPDKGFTDGSYANAQFNGPQGVCLKDEMLYVADTDNHAIRKVDLKRRHVITIVGTGIQGKDKEGGAVGIEQAISSPWDLALGPAVGDSSDNTVLYIAMAGSHQIWVYFLEDLEWYGNRKYSAGTCVRFAGSGCEENRNNSYPEKAGFAQPSGLAVSGHDGLGYIYVADSESSSIRSISLTDGSVKGLVGGEMDPLNLFAYGDQAGKGVNVKLQHPLGVSLVTRASGPLLVADSYNNKLKIVDPKTRTCCTIKMSGDTAVELNEPGGLCVDERHKRAYIADTNNHVIRVLDVEKLILSKFTVILPESDFNENEEIIPEDKTDTQQSPVVQGSLIVVPPGGSLDILLHLDSSEGVHLTEDAPNSWKLWSEDELLQEVLQAGTVPCEGELTDATDQTIVTIPAVSLKPRDNPVSLCLSCKLFICDTSGTCRMEKREIRRNIIIQEVTSSGGVVVTFKLTLS